MHRRNFYTLAEAAKVLGVHRETAARWARSGKLPVVRLSRKKVIVPKDKFAALVSEGSAAAVPLGSPQRWLRLVGTLTAREADCLLASVQDFEKLERNTQPRRSSAIPA